MNKLNREKQLETMLTIAVGFFLVAWSTKNKYVFFFALLIGLIGMFSKTLTSYISNGWMKVGEAMGAVSSRIILSIVYFLFLFPIALIYRIGRKDTLQLKKAETDSYFVTRNTRYETKDLKNPW
jgi:hypothetical protein